MCYIFYNFFFWHNWKYFGLIISLLKFLLLYAFVLSRMNSPQIDADWSSSTLSDIESRWMLSGRGRSYPDHISQPRVTATPIHNRSGSLIQLSSFIYHKPYEYLFNCLSCMPGWNSPHCPRWCRFNAKIAKNFNYPDCVIGISIPATQMCPPFQFLSDVHKYIHIFYMIFFAYIFCIKLRVDKVLF